MVIKSHPKVKEYGSDSKNGPCGFGLPYTLNATSLGLLSYKLEMTLTSSNNWFPVGSILESFRNSSSPTKQISCPSYTKKEKRNLANRHLGRKPWCSPSPSWVILTGSARMTTCTVAFPGVSRLTRGVRIFCFSLFIKSSKSGSLRKTQRKSELGILHHC